MLGHVEPQDLNTAYRFAFERSEAAIAIISMKSAPRLADATDAFLEEWRLSRNRAIGRRLDEIFTSESAEKLIGLTRRTNNADRPIIVALGQVATANQRVLDAEMRAAGLPNGLVAITLLTRSPMVEARRHALIDDLGLVTGGLIYIYDLAKQRTRYINKNLARLLGYGEDDTVSLADILPRVHPEDVDTLTSNVARFGDLIDGEVLRFSFRVCNSDGEYRWIDNRSGVFARDAKGEVRRVIGYAFDVTTPRRTMADLATASTALLHVEEKERRRIARELHDSTAQHLVAADLLLASHERRLLEPDSSLSEARDTLALALREIRTLSFLLHPPRLREQGLAKTLRTFAEGFARRAVLDTRIEIGEVSSDVSSDVELALFRVAQEALMNVRRHADADCVTVRLFERGDEIVLEIEDDGVGIGDIDNVSSGVGMDGMRARLSNLNGTLTVDSPGRGTRVRAIVGIERVAANSLQNSNLQTASQPKR